MCPLCANLQRCPASGIAKQAVATVELAFERRKGAIMSEVSILRFSRSSDLRDKGRSTLTVPRVKLIFSPRDYCGTYDTASHKLPQKGNETYTHTHTHTHTQRAANCYGSLINLCFPQNGATLTPIGLRSLKKFFFCKSIFISFLAIRW